MACGAGRSPASARARRQPRDGRGQPRRQRRREPAAAQVAVDERPMRGGAVADEEHRALERRQHVVPGSPTTGGVTRDPRVGAGVHLAAPGVHPRRDQQPSPASRLGRRARRQRVERRDADQRTRERHGQSLHRGDADAETGEGAGPDGHRQHVHVAGARPAAASASIEAARQLRRRRHAPRRPSTRPATRVAATRPRTSPSCVVVSSASVTMGPTR